MKKFLTLILFIFLLSCSKQDIIKPSSFEQLISNYPYDKNKIHLYEQIYQDTNNITFSLNKINYPTFLIPNSMQKEALFKNDILFVNTNYCLNSSFVPNDLVLVKNVDYIIRDYSQYINALVLEAYTKLYQDALNHNLFITIFSAYRSYDYQIILYNSSTNGFVAKPGTSEHQTGFALDIATRSSGLTSYFELTDEFIFLKNNAHKYGFILRYPLYKEEITGYPYESWHYRYVGIDVATFIYENGLTLEEYFYNYIVL